MIGWGQQFLEHATDCPHRVREGGREKEERGGLAENGEGGMPEDRWGREKEGERKMEAASV